MCDVTRVLALSELSALALFQELEEVRLVSCIL